MNNKIKLAGCVILKEDAILLQHRTKRNWYELPGGKLDENESPEQTAVRELKEELCCDVEIIEQLGVKDFVEDGFTMTYVWFLARIKENQEVKIGEPTKISHIHYIPIKDLESHNLSPNMERLLEEIKQKRVKLFKP